MIKSIISGLHTQNRALLARTCQDSLVRLRNAHSSQKNLIIALDDIYKQTEHVPELSEYLLVRTVLTVEYFLMYFSIPRMKYAPAL